mmetsp:Transcript_99351/g.289963  ORF Transcript_99351/g.289963 Transcript_99351/m.289963 type:complete len:207 (+) Transcript_99351:533-1153(+)
MPHEPVLTAEAGAKSGHDGNVWTRRQVYNLEHAAALPVWAAGLCPAHHLRPGSLALEEADVHGVLGRTLKEENQRHAIVCVTRHLKSPLRVREVLPEIVAATASCHFRPCTHGGAREVVIRHERRQVHQCSWNGCVNLDGEVERHLVSVLRNDKDEFSVSLQSLPPQLHKCTLTVGVHTLLQGRVWATKPLPSRVDVRSHIPCGDL